MAKPMAPTPPRTGKRLIFRASRMVNGVVHYARDYGYRAWPIWI